MEFHQRLYELRRQAGLSQEELAGLLGVSRQAVQKWEAGTSRPDLDNLAALGDYFGVSLDYLVAGKEPAARQEPSPPEGWSDLLPHYEYRSRRTLFGLPLVHIRVGMGPQWARGVVAIGNFATGVAALGGVTVGVFSLGGLSLGLLALGGLAAGLLALGGMAIGLLAAGAVALGWLAIGGAAGGAYAAGGAALGLRAAVGAAASAPVAVGRESVKGALAFLAPLGEGDLAALAAALEGTAPRWVAGLLFHLAAGL